ncbi:patatin-like phospholipase family protein [Acidiferrobacter sp.]|uniref:patatin-like phospholipase family protein n=1 Tax=Acidiferrobacter sp. TaxID=1872107 RepID=UPI00262B238E|nr:patatin-like phospholipase family protein [Acidiferrobacter sp.]
MVESTAEGLVLALGAGGARGLAHIGVLEVLAEHGLPVRAIAGASMGAEIGALYARYGDPAILADIALGVDWKQTLRLFLPDGAAMGGVCSGRKILAFLEGHMPGLSFGDLPLAFLAVAADLHSGEEVVLRSGSVAGAVRASLSLPGLLAPYPWEGRLLIDGGVVNPVPFDVAADSFGGPVVAVAVHQGARGLSAAPIDTRPATWRTQLRALLNQPWVARARPVRAWLEEQLAHPAGARALQWHMRSVLTQAINIAQAQIVQLRLLARRPALYLLPEVDHIGHFEFYKARTAIAAGRAVARAHLPDLYALLSSSRAHASADDAPE